MCRKAFLDAVQQYSEHADRLRNVFLAKLDEVVNEEPIIDKEKLKRVINVFRNHKYMDRDTFDKERTL